MKIDPKDRRVVAVALGGAAAIVVLAIAFASRPREAPSSTPQISRTAVSPTPAPGPSLDVFVTPPQAPVRTSAPAPSTIAPATPTPAPAEGLWRVEGLVVDKDGNPVPELCVAVGPHGCRPTSKRTDDRGVYFIDFPQADVDYDLHFLKDGEPDALYDARIHPKGPMTFNVVLPR